MTTKQAIRGMGHIGRITGTGAAAAALLSVSALSVQADEALADLVEQVSPSVVTVLSARDLKENTGAGHGSGVPRGGPMEEFFRQFGRPEGFGAPFGGDRPQRGLGSGFILDEGGYIVTNHHVIDGADTVTVELSDRRSFDAEVIGIDKQTDLALLKIDAGDDLPFVGLGDSEDIRIGEDVMAVGNPFGLGGTVTSGIVSAKGRNISAGPYAEFIQTDAAINKGNSGGPLFNMDGEVIGVNSAIYSPSGGSVGVGFAVSSNIVERIVDDLRDDGQVERGWLGVSIQDVTPEIAAALGLEKAKGALVSSVVEDSPADGELKTGDVILTFDGEDVGSSRDLPRLVAAAQSGEPSGILVLRDGSQKTLEVRIGTFEAADAGEAITEDAAGTAAELLGATVADLSDDARQRIGVGDDVEGVVITSLSASGAAAKAGLAVGDVIVEMGSAPITSTDQLEAALEEKDAGSTLALVNRSGRQIFVAIDLA